MAPKPSLILLYLVLGVYWIGFCLVPRARDCRMPFWLLIFMFVPILCAVPMMILLFKSSRLPREAYSIEDDQVEVPSAS